MTVSVTDVEEDGVLTLDVDEPGVAGQPSFSYDGTTGWANDEMAAGRAITVGAG